jgi:hypothetical protein
MAGATTPYAHARKLSRVKGVRFGFYFGQRYSKSQDWRILLFRPSGLD